MANTNIQFDLSFDSDNRFGASLLQGDFTYIAEIDPPSRDQQMAQAETIVKTQLAELSELNWIFALSVNDRTPDDLYYQGVDFLKTITDATHKVLIFGLAGKQMTLDDIKASATRIKSTGCRNIFAVTGNWLDRMPNPGFTDSVDIVRATASMGPDINVGGSINPFKYAVQDIQLQYAKMKRKISNGAKFFVSQAGWDMKKAQELQWYLQMYDLPIPVFARIIIVTPENLESLRQGQARQECPYPLPICEVLLRAAQESTENFVNRQLDLLALQVIGYQKLGFSGIQIGGCRDIAILKQLHQKIEDLAAKCPDYNAWLTLWQRTFQDYNMALSPNPYYLYPNLLQLDERDPDFSKHPMTAAVVGFPTFSDRLEAKLNRYAAKKCKKEWLRNLICKFTKADPEGLANLEPTNYLNNASCPKHLTKGQCGNVGADGRCYVTGKECFFHRVLKLAAYKNRQYRLENDN